MSTQTERVFEILVRRGEDGLTALEALEEVRTMRLAACIYVLRCSDLRLDGERARIDTENLRTISGKLVAKYVLRRQSSPAHAERVARATATVAHRDPSKRRTSPPGLVFSLSDAPTGGLPPRSDAKRAYDRDAKRRQRERSKFAPVPAFFDDDPGTGRLRSGLIERKPPRRMP